MPRQIQKSFQECLSKIKISNKQIQFSLRGCRHPRTRSFAVGNGGKGKEQQDDAVTLSDVDQFLYENFRSLYQTEYDEDQEQQRDLSSKGKAAAAFVFESPRLLDLPPPENLCGSARFFVTSGSSSSLIVDEAVAYCNSSTTSTSTSTSASPEAMKINNISNEEEEEEEEDEEEVVMAPEDFIALLTYSRSPYEDFRRSMQEMVEARVEHNGKVDWGFMEELLFCYLDLNNKKSYRFILRAFVDLVVVLRENSGRIPVSRPPPPWNSGGGGRRRQLRGDN